MTDQPSTFNHFYVAPLGESSSAHFGSSPLAELQPVGGAPIKVLGLGGGGSNAVGRMNELGLSGVDFIAANTDAQALTRCNVPQRIQLGARSTRGLGAGGAPEIGERAARESRDEIAEALAGADMVFLTAGMGGGTGTGAIPVAAEVSRSLGAVTIAVVTMPFSFEGSRRAAAGRSGIERLRQQVDTLIVVPNDRLLQIVPRGVSFEVAFHVADDVLRQGVQGVAELVMRPGLVNVDFGHVRRLMQLAGGAFLAIGHGRGGNKALDAAHQALRHPLLDFGAIDHAAGVLVHFTGGDDLTLHEVSQAVGTITEAASPDAEIIFGAAVDPALNGTVQVILIATGVGSQPLNNVVIGAPDAALNGASGGPVPYLASRTLRDHRVTGTHGRTERTGGEEAQNAEGTVELAVVETRSPARPAREARPEVDEPAFLRRRRALLHQRS